LSVFPTAGSRGVILASMGGGHGASSKKKRSAWDLRMKCDGKGGKRRWGVKKRRKGLRPKDAVIAQTGQEQGPWLQQATPKMLGGKKGKEIRIPSLRASSDDKEKLSCREEKQVGGSEKRGGILSTPGPSSSKEDMKEMGGIGEKSIAAQKRKIGSTNRSFTRSTRKKNGRKENAKRRGTGRLSTKGDEGTH